MVMPDARLFSLLKDMEKVSLLIPVYGVEPFIKRCSVSLFGQTYENLEYIFVDDCSPDRSMEIIRQTLESYPQRKKQVKIIRHTTNRGLSAARNTAVEHVTGTYLMHVDSDDFLEKDAVERMLTTAVRTSADIVICDSYLVYQKEKKCYPVFIPSDKQEYIRCLLHKSVPPSIWGKLFSVSFYKASGVRSIEGLNHGEDYATVPRLVYYARKVVKIDVPLYNYVQSNTTAYTKNITEKSVQSMVWAEDVLMNFFRKVAGTAYDKELEIAKLRTKLTLFKMGNRKIYAFVNSLYPELDRIVAKNVSFTDRVLLFLARHEWYKLLEGCVHLGFWFKLRLLNRLG